jgi:hypothetical protein
VVQNEISESLWYSCVLVSRRYFYFVRIDNQSADQKENTRAIEARFAPYHRVEQGSVTSKWSCVHIQDTTQAELEKLYGKLRMSCDLFRRNQFTFRAASVINNRAYKRVYPRADCDSRSLLLLSRLPKAPRKGRRPGSKIANSKERTRKSWVVVLSSGKALAEPLREKISPGRDHHTVRSHHVSLCALWGYSTPPNR